MKELQNLPIETIGIKEKNTFPKIKFTIEDVFLNLVSILMIFFSLKMIQNRAGGIWLTLLSIVFCLVVYLYAKKKHIKIEKITYRYLLYNLLLGLSFSFFENTIFLDFNMIFLALSSIYWVLTLGNARETGTLNNQFFYNILKSLFVLPFRRIQETFSIYSFKKSKNVQYILLGIVISLPLLGIVISLLSSADRLFDSWVSVIMIQLSDNIYENLVLFLFSIPIGYYVFLFLYRNLLPQELMERTKKIIKKPSAIFLTILTIFIIIYLIFFVSSTLSFIDFQKNTITASAISLYARDGFFQLVIVALINVGIFAIVKIFGDQDSPSIKILLSFIGVETLGLIFIAFAKMLLYISNFGLTIMRYNTSVFMMVLFLCITFFIIGLWKPFNYIGFSIVAIAITILVVSYQNAGNFIASYNYQKYEKEIIGKSFIRDFDTLGVDAVPTASEIYKESNDKEIKSDIESFFKRIEVRITDNSNNSISYSRQKAEKLINEFKEEK